MQPSTAERRWGITVPVNNVPLERQAEVARELEDIGYTDLWSAEGPRTEGFIPLAVAAAVTRHVHLGIGIVPTFTRGPALLAQTAATLAATAPGRFTLGLGSSSNVIVEQWNDIPFTKPLSHNRDVLRFLRIALAGEKVDREFDTFAVKGFKLALLPEQQPTVLLAGLRGKMLALAGEEADGAVINWLSASDVPHVASVVRQHGPRQIVARVLVAATTDTELARSVGRRLVAGYLNVPVYRAFHEELGRGDELAPMWKLWAEGERAAALEAIPDHVVDSLVLHGRPEEIGERVEEYAVQGVDVPVIQLLEVPGLDSVAAYRSLAPSR